MVCFFAAHGDGLELLELGEEVFDEMPPFVDFQIDLQRRLALRSLGDNDLGAALVHLFDDPVGIEGLVGQDGVKFDALDQRRDTDCVIAVAGQQLEAHEIAQGVRQGNDFCCPAALGFADCLILSPPLAPCP